MKTYTAKFEYQKHNGFLKDFQANNQTHAWQLAKEYEKTDNAGATKSERIRLVSIKEKINSLETQSNF